MWNSLAGVAVADHAGPERHHLHVAARARAGHGELAEVALDLDQAQHQADVEPGALGSRTRRSAGIPCASASRSCFLLQPLAHRAQPAQVGQPRLGVARTPAPAAPCCAIAELSAVRTESISGSSICAAGVRRRACSDNAAGQRAARAAADCAVDSMLMRRSRPCRKAGDLGGRHLGGRACRGGAGTRAGLPSGRGRRCTTRCGTPISSQSANIAPGRSPRSSSITSTPAGQQLRRAASRQPP